MVPISPTWPASRAERVRQSVALWSIIPWSSPSLTTARLHVSAEVDAVCGAGYRERSDERTNQRNGFRERAWDTRVGTIGLKIPKLRQGSYFPTWLLEPRRRAEERSPR